MAGEPLLTDAEQHLRALSAEAGHQKKYTDGATESGFQVTFGLSAGRVFLSLASKESLQSQHDLSGPRF